MAAPTTEAAIDAIRTLVIGGELPPGSRLPAEADLAAQLNLSRGTLREAVRALATAGVLHVRRGDGTYVTSLEPELLLDGIGFAIDLMQEDRALEILELRKILEPAATALAAVRRSDEELATLDHCLTEMRKTHGELRITQDIEFHSRIAAAAGNQTLQTLLTGISGRTRNARVWHGAIDAQADRRAQEEHQAIFDAIVESDTTLAHSAALVHVANTERWYRNFLRVSQDRAGATTDAG